MMALLRDSLFFRSFFFFFWGGEVCCFSLVCYLPSDQWCLGLLLITIAGRLVRMAGIASFKLILE